MDRTRAVAAQRLFWLVLAIGMALTSVAHAWWDDAWPLRKRITVDTTAVTPPVDGAIERIPLLVRLSDPAFPFFRAHENGIDIRFVTADDAETPVTFHIEKYDALQGIGLVWLDGRDIQPGTTQDLWVYYGNPEAAAVGNPAQTFDADTVLVYHFSELGEPPLDSTEYGNHAATPGLASPAGQIGNAAKFDGATTIEIPATQWLSFPDGAPLTVSMWLKVDEGRENAIVLSRRFGSASFLIGVDGATPFVEIGRPDGPIRIVSDVPLAPGAWQHVAVTGAEDEVSLYVDGQPTATVTATFPGIGGPITLGGDPFAPAPRVAAAPADVAAAPAEVNDATAEPSPETPEADTAAAEPATSEAGDPTTAPPATAATPSPTTQPAQATPSTTGFVGEIDELRIARVARTPTEIAGMVASEGTETGLVTLAVEEESSSWLTGYFAIILKSVTFDGWVVIAILFVMAVISWVVMYAKGVFVSRQDKANDVFRATFEKVANDLDLLETMDPDQLLGGGQELPAKTKRKLRSSSLYRLYSSGCLELRGRVNRRSRQQADAQSGLILSPQMLAAVRARIDGRMVMESQKLNRMMVMLTIAISGGPFLGLFGTCIGVMITFAGIAAVGEVNINAIAPGVAAALTATVAGLAVAIPALFGYNYLLTRIKTVQADMQVFIDEFVTRLAETFAPDRYANDDRIAAE